MKIKLLKKLRKRYNWYFRSDNFPVLIDHYNKSIRVYDVEYLTERLKLTLEDVEKQVKVSHDEWAMRWLKTDILGKYGWSMGKVFYKSSVGIYKSKLTK